MADKVEEQESHAGELRRPPKSYDGHQGYDGHQQSHTEDEDEESCPVFREAEEHRPRNTKKGTHDIDALETKYIDHITKAVASSDAAAVAHWLALEPPGRLGWEGREWYLQCACQEAAQAKERPIVQLLVDDMRARRST